MAIKHMKKTSSSFRTASGALYTEKITLTVGESDVLILPLTRIYAIAILIDGTGTIEFSNDSMADLEAATAEFVEWDGVSEINLGVTALKVVWGSGTVTTRIVVKTETE